LKVAYSQYKSAFEGCSKTQWTKFQKSCRK